MELSEIEKLLLESADLMKRLSSKRAYRRLSEKLEENYREGLEIFKIYADLNRPMEAWLPKALEKMHESGLMKELKAENCLAEDQYFFDKIMAWKTAYNKLNEVEE